MSHQARNRSPQPRARVLRDSVLGRLAEIQRPRLRRHLLPQTLAILQHVAPVVAVEVVDGAAGADEQELLVTQRAQRGADLDVEVRIEARVHADDGGGRAGAGVREHADQDHVRVMDPLECGVCGDTESGVAEHVNAALGGGEVGLGRPVLVGGEWDEGTWRFCGRWVRGHFDAIAETVPVRPHDDDALDAVGERLVAAFLPVRARLRVGVQHACRAMREEMHWSLTWRSLVL